MDKSAAEQTIQTAKFHDCHAGPDPASRAPQSLAELQFPNPGPDF
ncbi:MAG: hypothetical protein ACYSPI_13515 [Planctomycetota bacterium]|jgi:hypothetical protein